MIWETLLKDSIIYLSIHTTIIYISYHYLCLLYLFFLSVCLWRVHCLVSMSIS